MHTYLTASRTTICWSAGINCPIILNASKPFFIGVMTNTRRSPGTASGIMGK